MQNISGQVLAILSGYVKDRPEPCFQEMFKLYFQDMLRTCLRHTFMTYSGQIKAILSEHIKDRYEPYFQDRYKLCFQDICSGKISILSGQV